MGWSNKFHRAYPGLKFNKPSLSKRFGIPVSILDQVYDRGLSAGRHFGNPYGWAVARTEKFILVHTGKAKNKPKSNENLHLKIKQRS
jgi:hypothetical protein